MSDFVEGIKKIVINLMEERKLCDVQYGTVISESPLQIRLNQKLVLSESQLRLTGQVKDRTVKCKLNGIGQNITLENHLKTGEKVIMIRSQGGQSFLVLDRYKD